MKKNSKRYREILKNSIKDKKISPKEALDLVKKNSTNSMLFVSNFVSNY